MEKYMKLAYEQQINSLKIITTKLRSHCATNTFLNKTELNTTIKIIDTLEHLILELELMIQ